MADIAAFLRMDGSFQRVNISAGSTAGHVDKTGMRQKIQKRPDNAEYSVKYLRDQQEKLFQAFTEVQSAEAHTGGECQIDPDETDPIYTKYNFNNIIQSDVPLPICGSQEEILEKIAANPVVVIQGNTGCGKSTQLPQMILDDCRSRQKRCNIIVTQPRRLAARSIAERVSRERAWELGSLVGYQIALDKQFTSEDTRILFCTTGLLLEKLIKAKTMANYTHIILDEVHERDKNMDFLFIIIRMLLCTNSPNVKIILMSATIEAPRFAEYFKLPVDDELVPAPVIQIDQNNQFTVKNYYLDDLKKYNGTEFLVDFEKPSICDEMYRVALKLIILMQKLDDNDPERLTSSPTILIFLPGINEINSLHDVLTEYTKPRLANLKWKILVLHSLLNLDQQHSIYRDVDSDVRKIILSTNIAESSLTVPNVRYVIDFCLTKTIQTDSATNFTSLCLDWASRNNLTQRSGRAGRVMNGRCYRLIPKNMFEYYLPQSAQPELLRSPLENVVLKAKMLDMGPPHQLLALAMDTPKLSNVANTILVLKELGAMLPTVKGKKYIHDGDITFMGIVMATLPVDVRVARLVVLGYMFSVLEDSIIMAAGLNVKSIFTQSLHDGLGAYSRKLEWSNGTGSDLFAIYNAYKLWTCKRNQNDFGSTTQQIKVNEQAFGQKHSIEIRSLRDCHLLVQDLKKRLTDLGIEEPTGVNRVIWTEEQRTIIMKVVIGGAFYPNLFLRSTPDTQKYEADVFNTLNGRDPYTTVYYQGFNDQYIREMYTSSIKQLIGNGIVDEADKRSVKVSFGAQSERVFVTFEPPSNGVRGDHWMTNCSKIPGKIGIEVYKAIKMRKLRMRHKIRVMRPSEAPKMAEKLGLGFIDHGRFVKKPNVVIASRLSSLPRINEKSLDGKISHFENCERFWFQPAREDDRIRNILKTLNSVQSYGRTLVEFVDSEDIDTNVVIAARDKRNGTFFRARILGSDFDEATESSLFTVFYIDYGHTGVCKLEELRRLVNQEMQNLSPRCFECRLAEIQPTIIRSETNDWSPEANDIFRSHIDRADGKVTAEIYSVVNGVAHVVIFARGANINEILIDEELADVCEENYMSKANRWRRQHKQSMPASQFDNEYDLEADSQDMLEDAPDVEAPPIRLCNLEINLRGPFSPLESTLYSVMNSGISKTITVDPLSINSIMLDNDLHDSSSKYVVAAAISKNDSNSGNLIIRETTLLPPIRGIGPLIALMFCPTMELKRDETKTRYISFISGLGYNKKDKRPIFEEHDSIFHLDVELTHEDFAIINQLRYCFDTLLYRMNGPALNRIERMSKDSKVAIMIKIKELTLKLLTTKRNAMELHTDYHTWNQNDDADIIRPEQVYENQAIFPSHNILKLKPTDVHANTKLREQCAVLHNVAIQPWKMQPVLKCQLCAIDLDNIVQLRTHLISRLHLDREKQIGFSSNPN